MATHLKDGYPCIAYIVKVYRSLKGVDKTSGAVYVVLVPVDACGVVSAVVRFNI